LTLITRSPTGRENIQKKNQRKTFSKIWPKKNLKTKKNILYTHALVMLNVSSVWTKDMSRPNAYP